jgi:hypothetical protein
MTSETAPNDMPSGQTGLRCVSKGACRPLAKFIGLTALAGTILPPTAFMTGHLGHQPMQAIMLASAIAWFASAPFWMKVE